MYTYTYYVTHTVLIQYDIVNDGGLPLPLTVDSHDMYTYTYYVSHTVLIQYDIVNDGGLPCMGHIVCIGIHVM
jgi:hypothetical protein